MHIALAYFAAIRHLTDFSSQASKPSVHSSAEKRKINFLVVLDAYYAVRQDTAHVWIYVVNVSKRRTAKS